MPQPYHIIIDGYEANVPERVGSNVYAYELLSALEKLTRVQNVTVTVVLADPPLADLPKPRMRWRYTVVTPRFAWTQWALPIYLYQHRDEFDCFFTPSHYAPRFCPKPYISTVLDSGYLFYPKQFKLSDYLKLSRWTAYSVAGATKVLTISQASAKVIIDLYHKKPEDIIIGYPGNTTHPVAVPRVQDAALLTELGVTRPYILYLGTLQPRKNLVTTIRAFEYCRRNLASRSSGKKIKHSKSYSLSETTQPLQLVIAGRVGWLADEVLRAQAASEFATDILLVGFVSEQQKTVLYRNARCSVLLGLHEGFGIPPLESLQQGTIPVVAKAASLPEVVGPAGYLVDPQDPREAGEAFLEIMRLNSKELAIWRKKAREQVQKFSWQTTAQTVLSQLIQL